MSDISIDAREDDDVDIAVRNLELDFISISIGDVEIELTWEQGAALHRGLGDLFSDDPKDAARHTCGPADTFGCACVADDARECARLRGVDEDAYRCQCQCHVRLEEEAEDGG